MNRMSASACTSSSRALAEVGAQESRARVVVELVVDREVREVEEAVAHSRVLPVDDAQPLAIVQEVRVQKVVVARDGSVRRAPRLDPGGELVSPLVVPPAPGHRARARSSGSSRRHGTSRTCPKWPGRRETRAAPRRRARACPSRASAPPADSHPPRTASRASLRARRTQRPPARYPPLPRPWSRPVRPCGRCRGARCPSPRRGARTSSPSTSTLRLWFVIPPPRTSTRASRSGQTRSTASWRALTP